MSKDLCAKSGRHEKTIKLFGVFEKSLVLE